MRAPGFWWKRDSILGGLLSPLGTLYGAVAAARLRRPSFRAGVPVICVGNFVAGGAGKTPVALAITERLAALGRRPVFLTRGYGGTLRGPALVDLSLHDARQTGDEPQILAALAPTVISARRDAGAKLAATLGDVIVMDDGLQNPSLARTFSIAVVDGATGIGNGRCIPAGPLRAPMTDQWGLVQAVAVIGEGTPGDVVAEEAAGLGVPVLQAALRPSAESERLGREARLRLRRDRPAGEGLRDTREPRRGRGPHPKLRGPPALSAPHSRADGRGGGGGLASSWSRRKRTWRASAPVAPGFAGSIETIAVEAVFERARCAGSSDRVGAQRALSAFSRCRTASRLE